MKSSLKTLTACSLCATAALMLSYVEAIIPPLLPAFPGIKLGLANIVTVFVLYKLGKLPAFSVLLVRIVLSSLLFGSVTTLLYSLAGGIFSLGVMIVSKRIPIFSEVGVSVAGGISHNIGQISVAAFLFATPQLVFYLPVLAVSGTAAGTVIGIISALTVKAVRLPKR